MKCQLMQLSAIPIFAVEWPEDIVNKNNLSTLNNLDMESSGISNTLQISKNEHILELIELGNIKNIINSCSKIFTKDVLGINENFKMTHSWLTKNVKGSKHHSHSHAGLMFSSVTYFDSDLSDEELSPIHFYLPGLKNMFRDMFFSFDINTYNNLNSSTWTIYPKKNQVIFFPAHLHHETDVNENEKTRYCLASNYFINDIVNSKVSKHKFNLKI